MTLRAVAPGSSGLIIGTTLITGASGVLYNNSGTLGASTSVTTLGLTATANGILFANASGTVVDSGPTYDASTTTLSAATIASTTKFSGPALDLTTGTTPTKGWYSTGTNIKARLSGFDAITLDASNCTFGVSALVTGGLRLGSGNLWLIRAADNSIQYATTSGIGDATARTCINKAVASIADNTATTVFTVTIPNAAHSASIRVRLTGSSGAGGAIGANESTQDAEYMINVTRTAGVNAVATIGAVVSQAAAATVAGGTAVAVSGTLGAITGAVGATNTFTIQVTIARAGSTATNHTCFGFAELLNANASGVTIA